jgi:hypothetical protein
LIEPLQTGVDPRGDCRGDGIVAFHTRECMDAFADVWLALQYDRPLQGVWRWLRICVDRTNRKCYYENCQRMKLQSSYLTDIDAA